MNWLHGLIRKWVGDDRYHDQANDLNNRGLRVELLNQRLRYLEELDHADDHFDGERRRRRSPKYERRQQHG